MRQLFNQLAWSATKAKDSYLQILFRRLLPRLGVKKAIGPLRIASRDIRNVAVAESLPAR